MMMNKMMMNMMVMVVVVMVAMLMACTITAYAQQPGEYLILNDDFDTLNLDLWKHELTASGL